MEQRAKDAGFERIDPSQAVYVLVPGYAGRQPVVLAAPPGVSNSEFHWLKPSTANPYGIGCSSGINRLSDSVGGSSQ